MSAAFLTLTLRRLSERKEGAFLDCARLRRRHAPSLRTYWSHEVP